MPTIHDFGGFKVVIYFDDHNPPHFHVISKDEEVMVSIASLDVLAGSMNRKRLGTALAWAEENREILFDKWHEFRGSVG